MYLSTTYALNLLIYCDSGQKNRLVKAVNTHSNPYFSQLSRNPVDNLVHDPVIILG